MQFNFNAIEGICKMLEIIDKSNHARHFAYLCVILGFLATLCWLAPDLLKAVAEFILALRTQ